MNEQKISIDEQTLRRIMEYYKIGNHDVIAKYVKGLGIEHEDSG